MAADSPTQADPPSAESDVRPVELAATLPPPALEPASGEWGPGSIVDGRYAIVEKLGEGGMGAVFLAEHLKLKKQVALKTIHAELAGHAEIAARFAREAMASARIEHPGVVSALDYGTLDTGGAFLVMQFVRGEGMRNRLSREPVLPWREACELIEQITDAVAAAHAAGIVHRDLKPENVVLEPNPAGGHNVKVLDFGIAHLRAEARAPESTTHVRTALTRVGAVMGTPGYMAPEQAVGQPVDERTDIYALGVMLWECLAGRQPFTGDSLTEIIAQQFAPAPPALPAEAQEVPAELAALLARMLAPQLEQRSASAVEVRDTLRRLRLSDARLDGARVAWAKGGVLGEVGQRLQRLPKRVLVIAATALVLLVGLGLALSGGDPEPAAAGARSAAPSAPTKTAAKAAAPRAPVRKSEPAASDEEAGEGAAAKSAVTNAESDEKSGKSRRRAKRSAKGQQRSSDSPRLGTRIKRSLDQIFR